MLIVGLILLATAVVVGVDVASVNDLGVDVEAFGRFWATTTGAIFVIGFVCALVACLGLLMIGDGFARGARRRAERRALRTERDQLALEAERARAARIEAESQRGREGALIDKPALDLRDQRAERAESAGAERAEASERQGEGAFAAAEPGERLERKRHRLLHRG